MPELVAEPGPVSQEFGLELLLQGALFLNAVLHGDLRPMIGVGHISTLEDGSLQIGFYGENEEDYYKITMTKS